MKQYDVVWTEQSENSSQSMPFGGYTIGGNLWVQNDTVYFYLAQSGWFDENNSLLKAGRFALRLNPCPFKNGFRQSLQLEKGRIVVEGEEGFSLQAWAETSRPVVHIQLHTDIPRILLAQYQSWRTQDRRVNHLSYELFQCKELFYYPHADAVFHADTIEPAGSTLWFWHKNDNNDLSFDKEMIDQGLEKYREKVFNPQKNRIMGGCVDFGTLQYCQTEEGTFVDTPYKAWCFTSAKPCTSEQITICLDTQQTMFSAWKSDVEDCLLRAKKEVQKSDVEAQQFWKAYFEKSYVYIEQEKNTAAWRIGRNYNLFRYMLGLNAGGTWPTKFNGGLLTFDPSLGGDSPWSEDKLQYTPDYRLWGGGSHTIQNQRLLYWPMLKSGDFEMLPQHFEFFMRILPAARANTKAHIGAKGVFFPEQVGTYGLCCGCDNEWGNRSGLPVAQIKYHFSNSLETALMMLDYTDFTGTSPQKYMEFIENVLMFYDTFYPQNDEDGRMRLYPANALETYHVVQNPVDAIAGLTCVLQRLLALPETTAAQKKFWNRLLQRIPPLPKTQKNGKTILAAAQTTSLIHNVEIPQLYPVHPYSLYGLGKPDLQLAVDTALLAAETPDQLTHISWHPTGIQYARLGLLKEAWDFLVRKMDDGPFRFPAFWGPGHDWTPDHNWGGSGMLQLQEMLLQTDGDELRLLPCWPKELDVSFRLYAPKNTVVECVWKNGEIKKLTVIPESRRADIILPQ